MVSFILKSTEEVTLQIFIITKLFKMLPQSFKICIFETDVLVQVYVVDNEGSEVCLEKAGVPPTVIQFIHELRQSFTEYTHTILREQRQDRKS